MAAFKSSFLVLAVAILALAGISGTAVGSPPAINAIAVGGVVVARANQATTTSSVFVDQQPSALMSAKTFQGYMMAQHQLAHGFAFITDGFGGVPTQSYSGSRCAGQVGFL